MIHQSERPREIPALAEILQILRQNMPELSRRYKVKSLGVFGSYARGEADEESDIDLLVDLEDESLTLLQFIALENHLSDLLGVKVDLVEKKALKPAIGRHILEAVQAV
jgi:predicted nucleotidyltransferase